MLLRVFNGNHALYSPLHLPQALPAETPADMVVALASLPHLHENGQTRIAIFNLLAVTSKQFKSAGESTVSNTLSTPTSTPTQWQAWIGIEETQTTYGRIILIEIAVSASTSCIWRRDAASSVFMSSVCHD